MSNITIPSDPQTKQTLLNALKEMSNSMTRVDAEKDLQKEIIEEVSDKTEVPKKYISKLARIYHKQNISEVKTENDDLETLYEVVTAGD
jgi:viroplasmin and RNaseH domain-containing protein